MDDLIELIVRGIIRWMSTPKVNPSSPPPLPGRTAPSPGAQPVAPERIPNLPPAWQEQLRQVMTAGQQPRKGKGRRPAPPPLPVTKVTPVVQPAAPVPVALAARASTRQDVGSVTASLHRNMTPRMLREQYILTEILQPPLALREKR